MRRTAPLLLIFILATGLIGCGGGEKNAETDNPAGFWGVASGTPLTSADFELLGDSGIDVYRVFLPWARIESSPDGGYAWGEIDTTMAELARNGIQPLPFVFGTPEWLSENRSDPPLAPDQLGAYLAFLKAAVERYGSDGVFWEVLAVTEPGVRPQPVETWEIWNEQNIPAFWSPAASSDEYFELLKASAKIVRAADPRAEIMTGGLFGAPGAPGSQLSWRYLADLYSHQGVEEYFDVVGFHPYAPDAESVDAQLSKIRAVMDQAGDSSTPIAIDEIGWGSDPSSGSVVAKTPEGQAQELRSTFELLLDKRREYKLSSVVWYQYRDDPITGEGGCPFCASAGLFNEDRTPKPAWFAYLEFLE